MFDFSIVSAKIRRLYDIANILTSLNLIRKVHVTETRGRKPAFQYVGPEINILNLEGNGLCFTAEPVKSRSEFHSGYYCIIFLHLQSV